MERDTCQNCRYFQQFPSTNGLAINGLCRRYPPQVASESSDQFPVVALGQWCGEHSSHPSKEPDFRDMLFEDFIEKNGPCEAGWKLLRGVIRHRHRAKENGSEPDWPDAVTVGDVLRNGERGIGWLRGVGPMTVHDIRELFARHGIILKRHGE